MSKNEQKIKELNAGLKKIKEHLEKLTIPLSDPFMGMIDGLIEDSEA